MDITAPDGWTEIDTEFGQQLRAFRRGRDSLVLSVERGTSGYGGGKYSVVTLPENFTEDNQTIDSIGDADDEDEAAQLAESWMQNNPR